MAEERNCPNCSAPISSDTCPYCGTTFIDFAVMDMRKPFRMKIRASDGRVYSCDAVMPSFEIHYEYNTAFGDNSHIDARFYVIGGMEIVE